MAMDKMKDKKEMLKMLKKQMKDMQYGDMMNKDMEEGMEDMEGLKKVTVMSDTPEGLEEGLDTAEEILKEKMMMMKDGEMMEEEDAEEEEEEMPSEMKEKIKMMMKKKMMK